mmetsp:Transcript_12527/g.27099  ORF Transcript_12527/g.27099 Transcript_12527/m.27099 type:complete len:396 (+) Transcript_12527:131-1318(+)
MAPADVVIALCWARIQQYLDVLSLVSVSKSCHPLRDLVVDATTGKIKASVVKINNEIDVDDEGNIDVESPSARIFQYVPRLLNSIHFPSLAKLKVGFPPNITTFGINNDDDDDGRQQRQQRIVDENAFPEAFPLFAIEVERAIHLEELEINVNSLIVHEEAGALQSSFEILRDNLAFLTRRTRKLKRLTLVNELTLDANEDGAYHHSRYSSAFLASMVPVIRACLLSLEDVTVLCGDVPACRDYPNAGKDFFEAVLSLQKLKTLEVRIQSFHGPLLNDFVDAARSIQTTLGKFPSESLECVNFPVRFLRAGGGGQQLRYPRPSIAPFLSLCRDARYLREFFVCEYSFHGQVLRSNIHEIHLLLTHTIIFCITLLFHSQGFPKNAGIPLALLHWVI